MGPPASLPWTRAMLPGCLLPSVCTLMSLACVSSLSRESRSWLFHFSFSPHVEKVSGRWGGLCPAELGDAQNPSRSPWSSPMVFQRRQEPTACGSSPPAECSDPSLWTVLLTDAWGEGRPGTGVWQGLLLSSLELWPPRPPAWRALLEEWVMGCGLSVGLGWPGPCGQQCPSRGLDGKPQEVLSSLANHCKS